MMQKEIVYKHVKTESESHGIPLTMKAVEEFEELIFELKKAVESMRQTGCIPNYFELCDEIADVISVTEQNTGKTTMLADIHHRFGFKLNRLWRRFLSGQLFERTK